MIVGWSKIHPDQERFAEDTSLNAVENMIIDSSNSYSNPPTAATTTTTTTNLESLELESELEEDSEVAAAAGASRPEGGEPVDDDDDGAPDYHWTVHVMLCWLSNVAERSRGQLMDLTALMEVSSAKRFYPLHRTHHRAHCIKVGAF
eukprot:scaffold3216_cov180-Skeletonema_marinoi.AAC.1